MLIDIVSIVIVVFVVGEWRKRVGDDVTGDYVIEQVPGCDRWRPLSTKLDRAASPAERTNKRNCVSLNATTTTTRTTRTIYIIKIGM